MMKCDMCTDRTAEGLTAPMCASVCPSEALWYGTVEQFDDSDAVRCCATSCSAARRCAPRCTRSSTTSRRPARRRPPGSNDAGSTTIRPRTIGRSNERRQIRWRRPIWNVTSPTKRSPRRGHPSRFARYLVLGTGTMAAGNVGLAAWTQLRSINDGDPAHRRARGVPSVAPPVPLPGRRRPRILLRLDDRGGRRLQPEVHPPRLRRLLPVRRAAMDCPCHEGNFDTRPAPCCRARRAPLGRIDVEIRDDGRSGRSGGASEDFGTRPDIVAVLLYVIILVAFQVFLITVAVEAFETDQSRCLGDRHGLGRAVRRRPRLPARPPPVARPRHCSPTPAASPIATLYPATSRW